MRHPLSSAWRVSWVFPCAFFVMSASFVSARAAEPPPGFQALFNGKDLTGWRGFVASPPKLRALSMEDRLEEQAAADKRMREHWRIVDGVLFFDGKGDNLCTLQNYADFELLVDWKILAGGDSGIYVRGVPQIQIWDNPVGSGGLYNNKLTRSTPLVRADRPVGEWNTFRIRMRGDRVTVYLNGLLVVDDLPVENYWEADQPLYPKGPIELQNHGNPLFFRNVFIRELTPLPPVDARGTLQRGDFVAIAGDSITEQRLYSRFMETYLVACLPQLELRVMQFGWSGERAPGFLARLQNDVLAFRPNVVTTCYGMNDGQYRRYEPEIGKTYATAMQDAVEQVIDFGAQVVVGSPGAVDTTFFRRNISPSVYNANLAELRDIAREIARAKKVPFANVHDAMRLADVRAKAALGDKYDVCGADGFHPRANGHLVMAYAFLKALGLDGEIGRIEIDLEGQATASDGHRVLSQTKGKVELESSRYPFCFSGDEKSPTSTRSIVPFVPFNDELNRLTLTVKNLKTDKAMVRWGPQKGGAEKVFTRAELKAGINLAAVFPESPFQDAFHRVDELVARKQRFETEMIKGVVTRLRTARRLLGENEEASRAIEALRRAFESRANAWHVEVRNAVQPVRHTLEVVER